MPTIQRKVTLQMAQHLELNLKTYQKAGYALSVVQKKDDLKGYEIWQDLIKPSGFGVSFLI